MDGRLGGSQPHASSPHGPLILPPKLLGTSHSQSLARSNPNSPADTGCSVAGVCSGGGRDATPLTLAVFPPCTCEPDGFNPLCGAHADGRDTSVDWPRLIDLEAAQS